jgi:hypothetical protein
MCFIERHTNAGAFAFTSAPLSRRYFTTLFELCSIARNSGVPPSLVCAPEKREERREKRREKRREEKREEKRREERDDE